MRFAGSFVGQRDANEHEVFFFNRSRTRQGLFGPVYKESPVVIVLMLTFNYVFQQRA